MIPTVYPMRKTPLAKQGKSEVALCKRRIQALLREIVVIRDGGCVLRHFTQAGKCGGYRNDGKLILQAEHLISRKRNISFADLRNVICLCKRHHGYFKPQNSRLYWELMHEIIGPVRKEWLDKTEKDQKVYHMTFWDWQKVELFLQHELQELRVQIQIQNTRTKK